MSEQKKDDRGLTWHDIATWGVEGQGWTDVESPFDRLPARAKGTVSEVVWDLSRMSAGLHVRFETDAPSVTARWTLTSKQFAMINMPASGVSGLDLYAKDERGTWRWLSTACPGESTDCEAGLASGMPPARRSYLLCLPLYNGVSSVRIGVDPKAHLAPLPRRKTKPVVIYGTSIVHGACASRPGTCHAAILGRRLDREIINLGFSGNGRMNPEIAELMGELDAAVFVIDCLPNMNGDEVAERTEPFIRILRKARPDTPIVLVEDRTGPHTTFFPDGRLQHVHRRAALRAACRNLTDAGLHGLFYLEGERLLGDDGDDTVDGSHPTDLGFWRMANAYESIVRPLVP